MKKTIQIFALVLAIGATVQTLKAYAFEAQTISVEEEEYKVMRLMEIRKQISLQGENLVTNDVLSADFPEIRSHADVNVSLVKHLVRYIFAIGAEKSLFDFLKSSEVQAACAASASAFASCGEPGI